MVKRIGNKRYRSLTISAADQFTDPITLRKGGIATISGTFVATIAVQKRGADGVFKNVSDNYGVELTFDAPSNTISINPNGITGDYRIGATAFTSGDPFVEIQGN